MVLTQTIISYSEYFTIGNSIYFCNIRIENGRISNYDVLSVWSLLTHTIPQSCFGTEFDKIRFTSEIS